MADLLFPALLSYKWRGIEFPCSSFDFELTQDHAEHKWMDRDGAHIEATGRSPHVYTAQAIFRNNVAHGVSESWAQALYPTQFRRFINACADRTSGTLQHPEFGARNVKCKSAKVKWDANKRDGVDISVIWVESLDPGPKEKGLTSNSSPSSNAAQVLAQTLDTALVNYGLRAVPFIPKQHFSDLLTDITSIIDSGVLFEHQIAGKINGVIYKLNKLSDGISSLRDPKTWAISQSIEHLRYSLHNFGQQTSQTGSTVAHFLVPSPLSLAQISGILHVPVSDLISLNPALAVSPIVAASSIVRYLQSV